MKRIIATLLISVICLGVFPVGAFAAEDEGEFLLTEENVEILYSGIDSYGRGFDILFGDDDTVAYWKHTNEMTEDMLSRIFIGASKQIIGEIRDKTYYAETLGNMMTCMKYDIVTQIETQSQFDDVKTGADYAIDALDIALSALGNEIKLEKVKQAISTVQGANSIIAASVEEAKYYEAIIKEYSHSETFLTAIIDNTDNLMLKAVAQELRTTNETLLTEKLKLAAGNVRQGVMFAASDYLDSFGTAVIKKLASSPSETVQSFARASADCTSTLLGVGGIFKACMLVGDVTFGTTNTFKRFNDMLTMGDIAEAINAANKKVVLSPDDDLDTLYGNLNKKTEYYKMMLSVHLRGENALFSLQYNEAGVLSEVTKLRDIYGASDVKTWYNEQIDNIEDYYDQLDNLYAAVFEPQVDEEARMRDAQIYHDYLVGGGIAKHSPHREDNGAEYMKFRSVLVDLNNDGVHELIIEMEDTKYPGPRGYPTRSTILGIENGQVIQISELYSGGGTMGDFFYQLYYDSKTKTMVLVQIGDYREGQGYREVYRKIYRCDGKTVTRNSVVAYISADPTDTINCGASEAAKAKANTTLWYDVDGRVEYYMIGDKYVSREDYNTECARYKTLKSNWFQKIEGTHSDPLGCGLG